MAFKFVALLACVAAASAGLLPVEQQHHQLPSEHHNSYYQEPQVYAAAPVHHVSAPHQQLVLQKHQPHHVAHEVYPDDPHPKYNFSYDVKDAVSGDSKSQVESRDGDVVQGEYSLDDADGFRRTVKYTADSVHGFNAVVHREPLAHKVIATAATPVQYHHAAPAAYVKSAPVAYTAPTYASNPAHEHEHTAYASYEAPKETHDYYHH